MLSPFIGLVMMWPSAWSELSVAQCYAMLRMYRPKSLKNNSPLFQMQIDKLLANKSLVENALKRNPLEILALLAKIRSELDELIPDQADLFCLQLLTFTELCARELCETATTTLTQKQRKRLLLLQAMLLGRESRVECEASEILGLLSRENA